MKYVVLVIVGVLAIALLATAIFMNIMWLKVLAICVYAGEVFWGLYRIWPRL